MAYEITDDCTECTNCVVVCPTLAIGLGDGKFVIDANLCIDCGKCKAVCNENAILEG